MEIHIGSLIRRRLDEKGYSVARISTVLDYDFFILLSKSFRNKEADAKA